MQKQEQESDESDSENKNYKKVTDPKRQCSSTKKKCISEQLRRKTFEPVTPVKEWNEDSSLIKFDSNMNQNKENLAINRSQLSKLIKSEILVTSFSPLVNNGTAIFDSSFAYIKSSKNSPKSLYATPKSALSEINADNINDTSTEFIKFSTPMAKYNTNNTSMYLIDLTTPAQFKENISSHEIDLKKTPTNVNISKTSKLKSALKSFCPKENRTKSTKKVKMTCGESLVPSERNSGQGKPFSCKNNISKHETKFMNYISEDEDKYSNKICPESSNISLTKSKDENEDYCSIETIDDTIYFNDTNTTQENENVVIEVSDESTASIPSSPKKLTSTPKSKFRASNISQSLVKKALLSSTKKMSKTAIARSLISDKSPIHFQSKSASLFLSKNDNLNETLKDMRSVSLNKKNVSSIATPTKKNSISNNISSVKANSFKNSESLKNNRTSFLRSSLNKSVNSYSNSKRSCENSIKQKSIFPVKTSSKHIFVTSTSKPASKTKSVVESSTLNEMQNLENLESETSDKKGSCGEVNKNCNEIYQNNAENSALNETFTVESDDENFSLHISEKNCSDLNTILVQQRESETLTNCESPRITETQKLINSQNRNNVLVEKMINKRSIATPIFKGIKEMIRTPKVLKTPEMEDIKHMIKTPNFGKTQNFKGTKNMKTPQNEKSNVELLGVKELIKTPKIHESNFNAVGEMLKTPQPSLENSSFDTRLMRNIIENEYEGVDQIFKTPSAKAIMVSDKGNESTTIKKSLISNAENISKPIKFNLEDEIEPIVKTILFENSLKGVTENYTSTPHSTCNQTFDELIGSQNVVKTYSRRKKQSVTDPVMLLESSGLNDIAKSDIQEWIENISPEITESKEEIVTNIADISNVSGGLFDISGIDILNLTHKSVDSENKCSILHNINKIVKEKVKQINSPGDKYNLNIQKSFSLDTDKSKFKPNPDPLLEGTFNLETTNQQKEIEEDFEYFENQPIVNKQRSFTPETQIYKTKWNRKTIGNNQILDECFNLKVVKKQREMELAFQNFEEEPNLNNLKSLTPEYYKPRTKVTRKTMGNNQVLHESFDLKAAKEKRELELAFTNFEEEPNLNSLKSVTPEKCKPRTKVTRKTMGNNQVLHESFDLKAAKEKRELELAFTNFEEEPNLNSLKSVTPEKFKSRTKVTRKTMGNNQVLHESFDLKAAKEKREMELAFTNFEEEPNLNSLKSVTPEKCKPRTKVTRKTMGNNQVLHESFDLKAAKEERELELAFTNFEEEPNLNSLNSVTPEKCKPRTKVTRKTIGNNQVLHESFDLKAAKEKRELELAFTNFEEEPNLNSLKSVTPEKCKPRTKLMRKTMGNNQVLRESFDLKAAKEKREIELAFENFENQPNLKIQKSFTPEDRKSSIKLPRKTLGNNQVPRKSFDLKAAKEERELELAFTNFEEEPNLNKLKSFTPEKCKPRTKVTRKTMGNNQVLRDSFDLKAAKEKREIELAFENFENQPNLKIQKSFTPEDRKSRIKLTRKTMGNNQIPRKSFDLKAAKEKRELELAFTNFEEEPNLNSLKSFTPEKCKPRKKVTRKTMGNNQVLHESFDLKTAKEKRELELAFTNFEEEPNLNKLKSFTPEKCKPRTKVTRKTMGNNQVLHESFDLKAEKEKREIELALETLEAEPNCIPKKAYTAKEKKTMELEKKLKKTTQSSRKLRTRKIETDNHLDNNEIGYEEGKCKTYTFEPEFKTPTIVAPKTRTARRLRSNSTSTPVKLSEEICNISQIQINETTKISASSEKSKISGTVIENDELRNDINVDKKGRARTRQRKVVEKDEMDFAVIDETGKAKESESESIIKSENLELEKPVKKRSRRNLLKKKDEVINVETQMLDEQVSNERLNKATQRSERLRAPKIETDEHLHKNDINSEVLDCQELTSFEAQYKNMNIVVSKTETGRGWISNSTSTPVKLTEENCNISQIQINNTTKSSASSEKSKISGAVMENDKLGNDINLDKKLRARTRQRKVVGKDEVDFAANGELGRAKESESEAKSASIIKSENLESEEPVKKRSRRNLLKKNNEVINIETQILDEQVSNKKLNKATQRSERLRTPKIETDKHLHKNDINSEVLDCQELTSFEAQYKNMNIVVSKTETGRGLISNSTSTPVKLTEENYNISQIQINDTTKNSVSSGKSKTSGTILENDELRNDINVDKKGRTRTRQRKVDEKDKMDFVANGESNRVKEKESETKGRSIIKSDNLESEEPVKKRGRRNLIKKNDEVINVETQMLDEQVSDKKSNKASQRSGRLRTRKIEIDNHSDENDINAKGIDSKESTNFEEQYKIINIVVSKTGTGRGLISNSTSTPVKFVEENCNISQIQINDTTKSSASSEKSKINGTIIESDTNEDKKLTTRTRQKKVLEKDKLVESGILLSTTKENENKTKTESISESEKIELEEPVKKRGRRNLLKIKNNQSNNIETQMLNEQIATKLGDPVKSTELDENINTSFRRSKRLRNRKVISDSHSDSIDTEISEKEITHIEKRSTRRRK
ncbi:uncharacterized protein LOC129608128 [Condylostylus longicornis]|uniref:uncharacterized protein LOC129608128 n=1 Tax=Condylostylus longicornis TaxID=2530218 RepID=UPI00244E3224|nr:uncharacterized protein LOC129608128 [Condylostylus longicornis]